MKILALLSAVTGLAFCAPVAHASDWLFFEPWEGISYTFDASAPIDHYGAVPTQYWVPEAPATLTTSLGTTTDLNVVSFVIGGDYFGIAFEPYGSFEPTGLFQPQNTPNGYFFGDSGPKTGFYNNLVSSYIPGYPPSYAGFHETPLVVCNTATPGCSVAAILAAPEPSVWLLMLAGVGLLGAALRAPAIGKRRRARLAG